MNREYDEDFAKKSVADTCRFAIRNDRDLDLYERGHMNGIVACAPYGPLYESMGAYVKEWRKIVESFCPTLAIVIARKCGRI